MRLFFTENDAAFGEVVGGHFNRDLITGQNANTVFPHAARCVGDDFVFIRQEFYAKCRVGQKFHHLPLKLEQVFFSQGKVSYIGLQIRP